MKNLDNTPFEPPGTMEYLAKALRILLLHRPTMAHVARDSNALRVGLALTACGGALSVLTSADLKTFVFFGLYAVAVLFLFAGFIHLLAGYSRGKEEYLGFVRICALSSMIDCLAVIPTVGALIAALWGIAVAVAATEEVYGLTRGRAVLCTLAAVFILWFFTILLAGGPLASFYPLEETSGL